MAGTLASWEDGCHGSPFITPSSGLANSSPRGPACFNRTLSHRCHDRRLPVDLHRRLDTRRTYHDSRSRTARGESSTAGTILSPLAGGTLRVRAWAAAYPHSYSSRHLTH